MFSRHREVNESESVKMLDVQSCSTPCDPMDCSLPGSSVHGFPRQGYWSGLPFPSPREVYMSIKTENGIIIYRIMQDLVLSIYPGHLFLLVDEMMTSFLYNSSVVHGRTVFEVT